MENANHELINSIYTYSYAREERSLCKLEMRSFFEFDTDSHTLESSIKIDPSRSPFIKERIDVLLEGQSLQSIILEVKGLLIDNLTFKVIFVQDPSGDNLPFEKRQDIERSIGLQIKGEVDLNNPQQLFAIFNMNGRWGFGKLFQSESKWLQHQRKPFEYSTALSTRLARSVVNIAVPSPTGIKAIDPCCGIGTVLVEARSMGVDIEGSDINLRVVKGSRKNLAHFGYTTNVNQIDIRSVTGDYDVAIIDMPYNIFSPITDEERFEIFKSARTFASKVIVVTIDSADELIKKAGFMITDRCKATKNKVFSREVLICE